MIDLALLCNLYADGPTTLGRLKELGCESLEDVVALSGTDLGWALQESSEACERFRREARLLRERRGPVAGEVQASERSRGAAEPTPEARARTTGAGAATAGDPARTGQPEDERGSAIERRHASGAQRRASESGRRDGSLLDVLLRAWRRASGRDDDQDATDVAPSADANGPSEGSNAEVPRPTFEPRPPEPSVPERRAHDGPALAPSFEQRVELNAAPRRAEPTVDTAANSLAGQSPRAAAQAPATRAERVRRGTPLLRVGFEGVEADYARELEGLGIDTVEDFLASQPLDLAGRSSMRYTVLLRMQFVARRELERVP
ncbi:hypothetical protein Pla163_07250 [Planctomycetes bacterium Pla163]|uniref:Uncharacterized protein n=1 Tax=Rohdeia mirabilis TaxID=2528008 RepID=A0A518CWM4_9BACT|nr:hypothetical protein Pla163_07250 [Planctomycetes bacterium Pla163]